MVAAATAQRTLHLLIDQVENFPLPCGPEQPGSSVTADDFPGDDMLEVMQLEQRESGAHKQSGELMTIYDDSSGESGAGGGAGGYISC